MMKNERDILLATEDKTLRVGRRLTRLLLPEGGFVAMYGDLGAGKTTFARGMLDALKVKDIQSPTFTIVQAYNTNPPFYHMDAYRLGSVEELYAIGYEDIIRERHAIVLVEWANLIEEALPKERLDLRLTVDSYKDARWMRTTAWGERYESILWKI